LQQSVLAALALAALAVVPHDLVSADHTVALNDPAYIRSDIEVCLSGSLDTCHPPQDNNATLYQHATSATIEISIVKYRSPGPISLDRSSHMVRLVVTGSVAGTDQPASVIRTWIGTVQGYKGWKLTQLVTLPTQAEQRNAFNFFISVDGWPTGTASHIWVGLPKVAG